MNDIVPATTQTDASELVAVLLATHNGSRYLQEQLDSIAQQKHSHWRLVIADDGSQDDTLAIIKSFSSRFSDRVRVVPGEPAGSARDNFFRLIRNAGPAPYYALCDQDDVWSFDKLGRLVERCQQTEDPDVPCLVYSDLEVVDSELATLNPSFMNQVRANPQTITQKTLLAENAIPGCAMLFNSALADTFLAREFDQKNAIMHDWWIALLASTVGYISYIPSPLVKYRQHATNTLGSVERSGLAFVLSKLFRGDRSSALQTYRQAGAFVDAYSDLLDPAACKEMRTFASLHQRPKFERIRLILKHRLLKQTLGRRVYQLLRA
jgi:glycosyltransferase involved in cell wall biosynthesis